MSVRAATQADAAAIAAIYAPNVRDSHVSFEMDAPDAAAMRGRIARISATHPFLVRADEDDGAIEGFAYACAHRERAGYRWSADVSVYVAPSRHRRGVARALYGVLLDQLRDLGYYNAFAGIALPNEPSVALHQALGFRDVGVYRDVGFKNGAWHDTLWVQLRLRVPSGPPGEPVVEIAGGPNVL